MQSHHPMHKPKHVCTLTPLLRQEHGQLLIRPHQTWPIKPPVGHLPLQGLIWGIQVLSGPGEEGMRICAPCSAQEVHAEMKSRDTQLLPSSSVQHSGEGRDSQASWHLRLRACESWDLGKRNRRASLLLGTKSSHQPSRKGRGAS